MTSLQYIRQALINRPTFTLPVGLIPLIQYIKLAINIYRLSTGKVTFDSRLCRIGAYILVTIQVSLVIINIAKLFLT